MSFLKIDASDQDGVECGVPSSAPLTSSSSAELSATGLHTTRTLSQECAPEAAPKEIPLITIIIPSYNEEATVVQLLQRVWDVPLSKQIIVVDDGSTDGTCHAILNWKHASDLTIVCHGMNRGKGAAIRTGLAQATGRFTVIQDADLEYDPEDIPFLLAPLLEDSRCAVYGSRYLANPIRLWRIQRFFELGVLLLNWTVRLLYGVRLTDEATCYKLFSTEALRSMQLECERFEFCPEVTAKAIRMQIRIHELPASYRARTNEEGKKIRLCDGWEGIVSLWRYRHWCPRFLPPSLPVRNRGASPDVGTFCNQSKNALERSPSTTSDGSLGA